jgi:hypothetical protein
LLFDSAMTLVYERGKAGGFSLYPKVGISPSFLNE